MIKGNVIQRPFYIKCTIQIFDDMFKNLLQTSDYHFHLITGVCSMAILTTGATSGAEVAYPSGAPELNPGFIFIGVRVTLA